MKDLENLKAISEIGANLAQLSSSRLPGAASLALQLFEDLEVLCYAHPPLASLEYNERRKELRYLKLQKRKEAEERIANKGRAVWSEWHKRSLEWVSIRDEEKWINRMISRLPCGECKQSFPAILEDNPIDWNDYFGSVVKLHNEVNKKLGKPEITVEEARKIHGAVQ